MKIIVIPRPPIGHLNFVWYVFQARTSFSLVYQYIELSLRFGKHSKIFLDHVNLPVAITKQHNLWPISYAAQTKHTGRLFKRKQWPVYILYKRLIFIE